MTSWPDRSDAALERIRQRVLFDIGYPNRPRAGYKLPPRRIPSLELTANERRVIAALAAGLNRTETADVLGIDMGSVKSAIVRAKPKLAAKTTAQLTANAVRRGLIP